MDNQNQPGVDAGITQAQMDAAVSTARAEGAKSERTRISTIMDSDAAKDRPAAARHVALNSDMNANAAATFLAGLPKEAKGGYRTIAERAGEQVEAGGEGTSAEAAAKESMTAAAGVAAHTKSIDKINAMRGGA